MHAKILVLVGFSFVHLLVGCNSFPEAKTNTLHKLNQKDLALKLAESEKRISSVSNQFYNGRYHGDLQIEEAIHIIEAEIDVQKLLYRQYIKLPESSKSDKSLYMKFFQMGKYDWAPEVSMITALKRTK